MIDRPRSVSIWSSLTRKHHRFVSDEDDYWYQQMLVPALYIF